MSQVLPAKYPDGTGSVHSRISTVATMSLSATGSRKAPKGVLASCTCQHEHVLTMESSARKGMLTQARAR